MVNSTTTVSNLGIGPLPNGQPGVTILMTLSDGSSIPSLEQARGMVQQIQATIKERPLLPQPNIIGIDF